MIYQTEAIVEKTVEVLTMMQNLAQEGCVFNGIGLSNSASFSSLSDDCIISMLKESGIEHDAIDGSDWEILLRDGKDVPVIVKNGHYVWVMWHTFTIMNEVTMDVARCVFKLITGK